MRVQALIQGQAVLDGDVFAAQFSQPVVVEQIGYGWYDGRSGQEIGVQFRDVGASGQRFSWRLDRPDYNLTYVIVKDPNSGVRKIFRWRFIRLSPETQAAMAAQFSDVFAKNYANQYAQQYAQQYAAQYAQQYAQQMQQQLQDYINQVIQQQLGPGVLVSSNPNNNGNGPSNGPTNTKSFDEYVAYLYISDPYGVTWMASSGVQTLIGQGSGWVAIKLKGPVDIVAVQSYRNPNGLTCTADPPGDAVQAGGSYTFRLTCKPAPTWGYPPPEYPTATGIWSPPWGSTPIWFTSTVIPYTYTPTPTGPTIWSPPWGSTPPTDKIIWPPPTDATIGYTTERWWSYPPPEYPTATGTATIIWPPTITIPQPTAIWPTVLPTTPPTTPQPPTTQPPTTQPPTTTSDTGTGGGGGTTTSNYVNCDDDYQYYALYGYAYIPECEEGGYEGYLQKATSTPGVLGLCLSTGECSSSSDTSADTSNNSNLADTDNNGGESSDGSDDGFLDLGATGSSDTTGFSDSSNNEDDDYFYQ